MPESIDFPFDIPMVKDEVYHYKRTLMKEAGGKIYFRHDYECTWSNVPLMEFEFTGLWVDEVEGFEEKEVCRI